MVKYNWMQNDSVYTIQFDKYFCARVEWQQCQFYYVLYQCGFVLIEGYSDTTMLAKHRLIATWKNNRKHKFTGIIGNNY